MSERANSPATGRERLFDLLLSNSEAHEPWTDEALAVELARSVRTVQRWREWLKDTGRIPIPRQPKNGGSAATFSVATEIK